MVRAKSPRKEGAFSVDNQPFSGYNMEKTKNEVDFMWSFVSTWHFSKQAARAGMEILEKGGDAIVW